MKFLPMILSWILLELAVGKINMTADEQQLMNLPKYPAREWGIVYFEDNQQDRPQRKKLPVDKIDVSVETYGMIAHITSVFTYRNEKSEAIRETEFVFPMDPNATEYSLEVACTGMDLIIATVKEKKQAQKEHDEAREKGKTSALGNEVHADVFSFKLANLKPKTACTATFKFVQELYKYNFQGFNALFFRYPVELSPRFGEKHSHTNVLNEANFEFQLAVKEPQSMRLDADESFTISDEGKSLRFQGSFVKNVDVFIHVEDKPYAIVERGDPKASGFKKKNVVMVNFNPKFQSDSAAAQEFIMVVDRSGSMSGAKMELAKKTILQWVENLPTTEECLFNVISFGDVYSNWKSESLPCTLKNKSNATAHVKEMEADMGGTEIYKCLRSVLSSKSLKGLKQVFVVTDGQVSDQNAVISLVKKHQENSRIFSFGIGEGASAGLVHGIAQFNGVSRMILNKIGFLENSVQHALTVAKAEFYKDVRVTFPSGFSPSFTTSVPKGLFQGMPFTMYTEIPSDALENLQIKVEATTFDGKKRKFEVEIGLEENPMLPIHVLAAKRLIKELETGHRESDFYGRWDLTELGKKILELSTEMNVVSQVSSFIGTENVVPESKEESGFYQCSYTSKGGPGNHKRKRARECATFTSKGEYNPNFNEPSNSRECGKICSAGNPFYTKKMQIPSGFNPLLNVSPFGSPYFENPVTYGSIMSTVPNMLDSNAIPYGGVAKNPFSSQDLESFASEFLENNAKCQAKIPSDEQKRACLETLLKVIEQYILKIIFAKMKQYKK